MVVEFGDGPSVAVTWVFHCDTENFFIWSFVVGHFQNSDGCGFDDTSWKGWMGDKDEDVDWVAIDVQSLGNVAVVEGVKKGRI